MTESINLSKQTINLSKSEVINLSKQAEGLSDVMIALGWQENRDKYTEVERVIEPGFIGKLFGAQPKVVKQRVYQEKKYEYDLDAWVVFMDNGKPVSGAILYYGNKDMYNKGSNFAHHCGDDLVGGGKGDNEQIILKLNDIPSKYDGALVAVTIYQAKQRGQQFSNIKNMFVRVVDKKDNFEICRYEDSIAQEYKDCYTFIVGRLYKENGEWQFAADGYGTQDGSIGDAVHNYRA